MEMDSKPDSGSSEVGKDSVDSRTGDKTVLLENDALSNNGTSPSEGAPLQTRGGDDGSSKLQDEKQAGCIKEGEGLRILIISSAAFAVVITAALILQIQLGSPQVPLHGAVASDAGEDGQCSTVGVQILKRGGSSVDAAIATLLCNGVINAHSSGIGGGHFMVVHNHKTAETRVIDARETAPAAVQADMYKTNPDDQAMGAKSIAVPGELRGMEQAHQLYGRLPWADLFKPAIEIAKNGFTVGKEIESVLKRHVTVKDMTSTPLAKIYVTDGEFVKRGTLIKRPDLAGTLETIASAGADSFYTGKLADQIIDEVKAKGGILTRDDLKKYKVVLRAPIEVKFQNHTIVAPPLPAGGPALLMIMNIIDAYNYSKSEINTPDYYQALLENFKFSLSDFSSLGDPDFNSTLDKRTEAIISKAYAEEIKSKISLTKTFIKDAKHYNALNLGSDKVGTSHVSIVDADELFVSVTSSINYWFGSKLMTSGGILLNNHMADFSTPQIEGGNQFNYIEPGKRPLSHMCPTIVHSTIHKCGYRMAVGASNGSRILSGIAEVLLNYLVGEMSLKDAIDLPRIHDQMSPGGSWYEKSFPASVISKLKAIGHTLTQTDEGINVVQAVAKVNETLSAYSDPRKFSKADKF